MIDSPRASTDGQRRSRSAACGPGVAASPARRAVNAWVRRAGLMMAAGGLVSLAWLAPARGAHRAATQPEPSGIPGGVEDAPPPPVGIPGSTPPAPAPNTPTQPGQPTAPPTRPGAPIPTRPVPAQPGVTPAPATRPVTPAATPAPTPGAAAGSGAGENAIPVAATAEIVGDSFRFGPFAEGIELRVLIDLAQELGDLPIVITDDALLTKKVFLLRPVEVKKDRLLTFLNSLLEQKGATLVLDVAGIYNVRPIAEVQGRLGEGPFATTRIIPTSGLRPSSLQPVIAVALKGAGQNAGGQMAMLDDLGVIVMTDAPGRIETVENIIAALLAEQRKQELYQFPLRHVAANVAKDRLLALLGRGGGVNRPGIAPGGDAGGAASSTASLSNLADRLFPDPNANALTFRGRSDEQEFIRELLNVIDAPNRLTAEWFEFGSASRAIVEMARSQGLGRVLSLPSDTGGLGNAGGFNEAALFQQPGSPFAALGGQAQALEEGGSAFVLDPAGRGFIYYGTPEQKDRVRQIAEEFSEPLRADRIIYGFYKLRHSDAVEVAELIQSLVSNQLPTSNAPLLRGGAGNANANANARGRTQTPTPAPDNPDAPPAPGAAAAGDGPGVQALTVGDDVFITADEANNQIIVKAPAQLQPQFADLVEKLDLRRPQVYISTAIVAITATEDFRLAFETQLLSSGDATGGFQTNFGLSTRAAGGGFTDTRAVAPGLLGLTAAIIRSDQVPIIITALSNTVDTTILATPQLLVDDNEEAEVSSLDQRPTTTTSQVTGVPTQTSFGGFEPAGPRLVVTPRISQGDYLNLEYEIELSSFQGDPPVAGIPPPKQENRVSSGGVTVPSDATIVVGGLQFDQTSNTVIKVPFLGDIPLLGQLFRDERENITRRTVYIFITPRIMRDPSFQDLRLLTQGPAAMLQARDRSDLPLPEPAPIDVLTPGRTPALPPQDQRDAAPRGYGQRGGER